jgi:hypothetical protein
MIIGITILVFLILLRRALERDIPCMSLMLLAARI